MEFERRRVDDLGSPLTLYTVKNRINDQRCYIAIIYSQFECLILLQKTNFKAHSQKIFKIITCVCLIVVLFWFHLFIIIFFGFIWIIILNCQSVRAWGGGGVHGTKVSKKTPQNNLLKINIHRIVHSYFKFNIHKYCNVIYGKIFMFSAFNSALTTVHQGNPKYLYLLYIYTGCFPFSTS